MSSTEQNNVRESDAQFNNPQVVSRLTFSSESIKRLSTYDFNLETDELITLKDKRCMLILFYVENTESQRLATLWATAAQQVAGPIFAAVNMLNERRVAEAFTKLKAEGSNPLHWASLRQYPFILVYRNGYPVATYNGDRDVQTLIDYSLTLACQAGYYEPVQVGGSMQAESSIEMGSYQPYIDVQGQEPVVKKTSLQYNPEIPIRGFDPNLPIAYSGSQQSKQEAAVEGQEERERINTEEQAEQTENVQSQAEALEQAQGEEENAIPTPV